MPFLYRMESQHHEWILVLTSCRSLLPQFALKLIHTNNFVGAPVLLYCALWSNTLTSIIIYCFEYICIQNLCILCLVIFFFHISVLLPSHLPTLEISSFSLILEYVHDYLVVNHYIYCLLTCLKVQDQEFFSCS